MIVEKNDIVEINYIGTLEDGTIFDTSYEEVAKEGNIYNPERDYKPLKFHAGVGKVIKGFDDGIIGMEEGEERTLTIPPEDAYGEYRKDLVNSIPISALNRIGIEPEVNMLLNTRYGIAKIIEVTNTDAVIDFNHELAGETLIFQIKLEKIEKHQ
ncbi:MAG: peptidylprolyl isomerase [Candidatus Hydrothermarchaeota archaeon]